jgi:hypothetical protein
MRNNQTQLLEMAKVGKSFPTVTTHHMKKETKTKMSHNDEIMKGKLETGRPKCPSVAWGHPKPKAPQNPQNTGEDVELCPVKTTQASSPE